MDQEVLQDLFDRAVSQGYTKSIEDFANLISTDQEVLADNFNYVTSNGYSKSIEDFGMLVGVKKKEDTELVSPSGDGFSEQPIPDKSEEFAIDGKAVTQNEFEDYSNKMQAVSSTIDSTLEIPEDPKQEEFTDPITTELIDQEEEFVVPQLNYQYKDQGFVFEQSSLLGDAMTVTSANGKTIDVDLDVFSDSSKTEEANKLKIFLSENKLESKTLKSREFGYQENKQKFQNEKEITKVVKLINKDADVLSKRIQVYLKENSKVDQELKAISLLSSQQKIDQKNRIDQVVLRKKELDNIKLNLIRSEKNIRYRDKELQESAGKYFTMKSSQGTWGGAISNAILDGSARTGAGLANIATDVFTYFTPLESLMGKENYQKDFLLEAEKLNLGKPNKDQSIDDWIGSIDDDQVNKINKKIRDDARKQVKYSTVYYEDGVKKYRTPEEAKGLGLLDIQRTALREIAGDPATTVEWTDLKKQGFWGGALLGVAESLPAMLGAPGAAGWAQRTAQMYGQVSDYLTQEMQGDTDFNEISEAEKAAITVPIGIVVASLEAVGLRNVLRQKGFLNSILLKVLKKTPRNVKGVSFQKLVREEVDSAISRGVLVITAAGAAEFETGFAQEIADITGKMVYNKLKEKEMFTTPESLADAFAQVLRAGAQEAVGGFILGVPGAMNAATTKRSYAQIDDDTFQMFESIKNDPEYTSMYVTDIKNKILKGELTKEEGEKQISDFQDLVGLANKIPNDLSVTQKKQSLVLLKRKQELERRTEGKDASLVKKDLDEISSINTQLENIRFDKEAETKAESLPDFEATEEQTLEEDGKLTKDQKDIDSFFGEQTEETTETVESNLSINRAGEIVEQTSDELSTEATVISIAKKAAKAISKLLPNTRIVLHQNNQEFEKYASPGRGEIIGDTIHVNLSKAIATTVPHEIFHAVFLNKIKTDPRAAEVAEIMMKSVRKTLPNDSELARRIDTFAESYKDVSELQNEERLAELIGIMASEYQTLTKPQKNIVIKFIEDLARTLGVDINLTKFTKTDNDVIDLLNTLSTKVATGEEITEGDVEILEDGTNPVGDPTEIRVPKPRQQIEFEESYPLSLVTPDKRIDIISLVKDINVKKQKVWFWVADQLGFGDFQGIQLDAGPSYAFDGEAVWASSKSSKSIDKNINKADYLFIISGSPERSLLFNKKVYDVFIGKLGDFDTFKEDALATNPTKAVREILNNFNSWEALRDSPQRKAFLNAIVDQQGKPNTEFHKFIKSKDGFINTNDMRDGFYKANDFNINDVMVVIKPTSARDGSQHSTYDNEVLGEVLGVPDVKVNAFDIMPQEMVDKYKKQLTQQEKSQVVAPYGSGIRDVSPRQRRQQRTIEQVAQQYNMDNQGFIPKTANLSQLRKAVAPFGLEARQARVDQFGRGGGLFLVRNGRKFNPFAQTTRRQQRSIDNSLSKASLTTQVATTKGSYEKVARKISATDTKNALDYGAGLGLGTDVMSNILESQVDSFELNTERWKGKKPPTYTKSEDIIKTYDNIISLNVLNVVPSDVRGFILNDILSKLNPGGKAYISTRKFKGDIDQAKNFKLGPEEKSYIIKRRKGNETIDVYQKGFDGNELVDYIKETLGQDFKIQKDNSFGSSGVIITKPGARQRQQRTTEDYIREGREAGFRDELIIDYLRRVRKLKVKEIKDLMDIDSELLGALPESFKNIKKGAIAGLKLFLRVEAFILKENRLNTQRKKKLTDAKIMDKAIEFLEKQPEYKNEADTFKVKKETKARKTLSTQQALMLSDLQKTLNQRPTKDIALKIRIARAMVRNRSKGERDLQKIKRELRNFMRKTLPASVYTKSEAMNLLKKIESATSKNIENLMDEVILLATTKNNIALQKKIDNLLNGKYETMVSGRRKGIKIDSGTRDRINVIKKTLVNSTATAEEIDKINQSLTEQFQDLAKDPTPDENVFNKMSDLQIAINLNNALQMDDANLFKTVALDEAVQNLVGLVEGGRTLLRVILEKQAKQYRDQFSEVYYDVTGVKVDMESGDADSILKKQKSNRENKKIRDNVTKRVSKAIAGVANSIENQIFGTAEALDGLMDRISSLPGEMFGGRTEVLVTKRVDESSRNYKERKLGFEAVLQDKLMNLYGKNWKKISRKNNQPILTGIYRDLKAVEKAKKAFEENPTNKTKANYTKLKEENEEVLSQNQMYYLYNQYKDPSNKEAFDEMYDGDSARIMKEVEAKLDKKVKDFADWQVNEFFPAMYPYYNKVYKEIYRTNMPWNEFYAGRIYREGVVLEELDLLGDKSVFRTSVGSASTKSRVNSKLPIQKMDGTDALISYVNDMEYFAAYAETIRDINKLFTNQYLKAAIKNLHGDKVFTYIQKAIQKIANKGVRSEGYASFINGMNTVFILSRLGLSPVIMIKQLTSIFTYANDIGIRNWIKYSYKNLSELKSLWGEVRDNSVYMQDRKNNSILRQIESYSETGMKSFVPTPAKDFVVNFLMWTTKFGDRMAIMLGGLANYSYYKEQALSQGKTEKQAIDIAIIKFEKDTKRTQQSADLQDKDLYQTTNPVVRSLNMFLTTPKQYLRKEIQAVRGLSSKIAARDLKAGKGTLKENLRTLAMYHIFMPVIFQYISMGLPGLLRGWRDDDDDDLKRAAIIGNINALFVLGEMVTMAGDFFTGKPWAGQTKSLGAVTVMQSLIRKALKATKTKDPVKRADAWQDFQLELMTIVGVPGAQLKKFVENYSKVLDSKDMGESILRLLNFSNYQISGREKKQSAKKKMTKREMEMLMPGMYEEIKELEGGELEDLQNELKQMEKDMLNELYK